MLSPFKLKNIVLWEIATPLSVNLAVGANVPPYVPAVAPRVILVVASTAMLPLTASLDESHTRPLGSAGRLIVAKLPA